MRRWWVFHVSDDGQAAAVPNLPCREPSSTVSHPSLKRASAMSASASRISGAGVSVRVSRASVRRVPSTNATRRGRSASAGRCAHERPRRPRPARIRRRDRRGPRRTPAGPTGAERETARRGGHRPARPAAREHGDIVTITARRSPPVPARRMSGTTRGTTRSWDLHHRIDEEHLPLAGADRENREAAVVRELAEPVGEVALPLPAQPRDWLWSRCTSCPTRTTRPRCGPGFRRRRSVRGGDGGILDWRRRCRRRDDARTGRRGRC